MKRENDRAGDDYQEPSKEAEDGTWKPSKKAKLAAPDEDLILTVCLVPFFVLFVQLFVFAAASIQKVAQICSRGDEK